MTLERAVTWALIHFLWQGALLGGIGWAALRILRSTHARYAAACAVLALMAVAPVATALFLMRGSGAAPELAGDLPGIRGMVLGQVELAWTSALFEWLPLAWAAGATVLMLRACGGWWLARRRSLSGLRGVPSAIEGLVERMRQRLGVRRAVDVFESAVAATPQVFGWLRPLLLLPASALTGLTPEQLEAVVAHELAHIRRHDYLVNLLQTVIENLLYYHPAVWWVSSRIRVERELCCDEAAVAACGDPLLYSRALLQLEETRVPFAMAAGTGLKNRIGRILGMRQNDRTAGPALALVAALVLGGGMIWAQSAKTPPPAPPAPPAPAVAPVAPVSKARTPPPAPPPPAAPASPQAMDRADLDREMKDVQRKMFELQLQMERLAMRKLELEQQAAGTREQAEAIQRQASAQEYAAQQSQVQAEAAAIQAKAAQQRELERRIRYADERFAEPGKRGSETERGKLYIKRGPPDEIESHPSEGKEDWRYRDGGNYHFEKGRLSYIGMAI